MKPFAYYNEIDPEAAEWLRWLIERDMIPNGWVDETSICDVQPGDLDGYTQLHFFAGIGGWPLAARMAGWPDDRPIVTGSCPCQPFSVAGKGAGTADERHLWPDFFRIIRARRPPVVMGEQVAGKAGYGWFDGVAADLASENYASRYVDIPSCAVDAPHIRSRGYWIAVADADSEPRQQIARSAFGDEAAYGRAGRQQFQPNGDNRLPSNDEGRERDVADAMRAGRDASPLAGICRGEEISGSRHGCAERLHGVHSQLVSAEGKRRGEGRAEPEFRGGRATVAGADASIDLADADRERCEEQRGALAIREEQFCVERPASRNGSFWSDGEWIACHDGKARRAKPGVSMLVDGLPGRVAAWRGFGNAINPVLAAEVIKAFLETEEIN